MGLAAITGKCKFTGCTALFKGKSRNIGQWNHMCACALAGSSLWIMQNNVIDMNVGIGETKTTELCADRQLLGENVAGRCGSRSDY
jgi:hypothetical protein